VASGIASSIRKGLRQRTISQVIKKQQGCRFLQWGETSDCTGSILALTLVTSFGLKGIFKPHPAGDSDRCNTYPKHVHIHRSSGTAHREAKKLAKIPAHQKPRKYRSPFSVAIATIRHDPIWTGDLYPFLLHRLSERKSSLRRQTCLNFFFWQGALGDTVGLPPLADRWGHKRFLLISLALSFLFFFFSLQQRLITFVFLGISGMVLISTFALTTVMAKHFSSKSGNRFWDDGWIYHQCRGIGVTLLGVIADNWGVPMAIKAIFVLPLIAFGLGLLISILSKKQNDG